MVNARVWSEEVTKDLENPETQIWIERLRECELHTAQAISDGDGEIADIWWFLTTLCQSRLTMITVWELMNEGEYKEAWIALERVELSCKWLALNPFLDLKKFQVSSLARMVENWQSLFPYKVFISPEFVIAKEECSVCGQTMGPWSSCYHKAGHVYGGHFCSRTIKEVELAQIALVTDPVQKYSVVIPESEDGSDPMDYRQVEWVRDRCNGPFSRWCTDRGKRRHPHSAFEQKPNDLCPCGSEKNYGSCCLTRGGVDMPHLDVVFEHSVDPKLLGVFLAGPK